MKARLGQRDQAVALREAIGRTDSTPRARIKMQAYHQARIGGALGDRESAVGLLRRAFAHGWEHIEFYRKSPYDFLNLRDYPPFQELIKPKD